MGDLTGTSDVRRVPSAESETCGMNLPVGPDGALPLHKGEEARMIGSRYLRCTAVVAVALFSGTLVASYGAPATTSSAAVAAEHLAPIKIGVISTETSSSGRNTDGQVTAQRWQTYINSHGGIAGHAVEIIFKDDGDNPATAAQDFAELQQQGVIAIGDDSLVDSAVKSAAEDANIPVIGWGQSSASTLYGSGPDLLPRFRADNGHPRLNQT